MTPIQQLIQDNEGGFEKLAYLVKYRIEQQRTPNEEGANSAVNKLVNEFHSSQLSLLEEMIKDLENNPNEDGSTSPNIQHWIEQKQIQWRRSLQN